MKKAFIAICCGAVIWAGCKEHDAPIDFGTTVVAGTDSTYKLASAPASALHNVLVEEFTGQDCSNCPAAHQQLDVIAAANPGRINIVSLYFVGGPQTVPPSGHIYDFRDSLFATDLSGAGLYGGINGLPAAGIDRTPYQNQLVLVGSTLWGTAIALQESVADSVNLGVSSVYNTTTGIATITDTVTYTQNVSTKQSISIYIVEDSIKDKQADNTAPGLYDTAYIFNDVFRAMVATPVTGDPVLDTMAIKPAGQVYWRKYTFATKGTKILNPAHCRVIVFVNDPGTGGDYRVLQSVQCRLE
jgi:hypothetical protein